MNIKLVYFYLLSSSIVLVCMENTQPPFKMLIVEDVFPVYTRDFINEEIRALSQSDNFSVSVFSEKITTDPDHLAKLPDWMKPIPMHCFQTLPEDLDTYAIIVADWGHIGEKIAKLKHEKKYHGILATRFRGSPEERLGKPDITSYPYLKQHGDIYIPNCDFFKRELCSSFNFNPQKCFVCYGGVDIAAIKKMVASHAQISQTQTDAVTLFSACRLEPKKGILLALYAIANLIKKDIDVHYTIVGEGPQKAAIEELRAYLNLENHVTLLGGKSKKEVVQLIAQSDIFLAPSYTPESGDTEGIMNSLKETGLIARAIAVATNHAGSPELIEHDKTGVLAKQNDIPDLTNKIAYAIAHRDRWPEWRHNFQKKIEENFDGRAVYPQLIQILLNGITNTREQ
jgi:colanic acid/amylovoran biosynthesis glycosyltransferase